MGVYIGKYEDKYGSSNADKINDLINNDEYEEYFFDLLNNKYGEGTIEW